MSNLGAMIRDRRNELNLSLRELASMTNSSFSYIREIEVGNVLPEPKTVLKLAKALEMDIQPVLKATYKAQAQAILSEYINICYENGVSLSYEDLLMSGLPMLPLDNNTTSDEILNCIIKLSNALKTTNANTHEMMELLLRITNINQNHILELLNQTLKQYYERILLGDSEIDAYKKISTVITQSNNG